MRLFGVTILLLSIGQSGAENVDFRVLPYLQNPAPDAITILWFSADSTPGRLLYREEDDPEEVVTTRPVRAEALVYPEWEDDTFFAGEAPRL